MAPLHIAIVGSGIAGAAAALFLRRAGHRITQFERAENNAACGAGLLLQPPALAVLRAAGLEHELWLLGERVDYLAAEFVAAQQTIRLDYAQFAPNAVACGIQRAALVRILENADGRENDIHWSTRICSTDASRGVLRATSGETRGPYDLIVAADGTRSTMRRQCTEFVVHDRAYKDAAIVCLVDNPDSLFSSGVIQRFHAGTHVSTWPVGALRAGGTQRLTVALRVHSDDLPRLIANPGEWLAIVTRVHPQLAELIRASPSAPDLLAYTYRDVAMRNYFSQRVVLIGDAAHAMSPQLGLGASLGLLDAWYLARHLDDGDTVAQALATFDRARRADVERYQQMSRLATAFFQSDHRIVAALRERTAVFLGRSEIFRRRALAALCRVPRELI